MKTGVSSIAAGVVGTLKEARPLGQYSEASRTRCAKYAPRFDLVPRIVECKEDVFIRN